MDEETGELMPDMSGHRRRPRRQWVPEVMAFAHERERTLDEHNFAVDRLGGAHGTFRLQLFTAPGQRPVAIATQCWGMDVAEGQSLANGAEAYAGAVWERCFPDEPEPPVWIELQLLVDEEDEESDPLGDGFKATLFTVDAERPYRLRSPRWEPLEPEEVAQLVGGEVDATRGEGWNQPEPEPGEEPFFVPKAVLTLPATQPFRERGCMPTDSAPRVRRRLIRQLIPRRSARSCCWYHGGDWSRVSEVGIALAAAAAAEGVDGMDVWSWAKKRLGPYGLSDWETQALLSLLSIGTSIQPWPDGGGYVNGQHRAQAMLDQGVRRTVVMFWRPREQSSPAGDGARRDD